MRKIVPAFMALGLIVVSCSKDDEPSKKCDSCESKEGTKVEICDNGDDTFTLSNDGAQLTFKKEFFDALYVTPKEYIETICNGEPSL